MMDDSYPSNFVNRNTEVAHYKTLHKLSIKEVEELKDELSTLNKVNDLLDRELVLTKKENTILDTHIKILEKQVRLLELQLNTGIR